MRRIHIQAAYGDRQARKAATVCGHWLPVEYVRRYRSEVMGLFAGPHERQGRCENCVRIVLAHPDQVD